MPAAVHVKFTNVHHEIDEDERIVTVTYDVVTGDGLVLARKSMTRFFDEAVAEGWLTIEEHE